MPEKERDLAAEEQERIRTWHIERLQELGFSGFCLDNMIAADVDYHDVEKLLKKGATKNEVVRILL